MHVVIIKETDHSGIDYVLVFILYVLVFILYVLVIILHGQKIRNAKFSRKLKKSLNILQEKI